MADIVSPAQRSELMGRIRGRDTKPEIVLRRLLNRLGYRFRLHDAGLPGTPDIVFSRRRIALFVHGCFWHRHSCGKAYQPKSRREFWASKFARTTIRDAKVADDLRVMGWKSVVVWECELDNEDTLSRWLAAELGPPQFAGERARPPVADLVR